MKIVFVSDFLNHHQTVLCDSLKAKSDEFYFIYGHQGKVSRIKQRAERDYAILYKENAEKANNLILSADAVIFGACPGKLVDMRMEANKLSFIYSERLFKKNILQAFKPENYKMIKQRYLKYKDKNLYVLAASGFLSYDLSFYGFPQKNIFKWGYFPETITDGIGEKKENSILFVGRFLDWKHGETVIQVANLLKKDNLNFKISIVGGGPEEDNLKALVKDYNLSDCVDFLGIKSHEETLKIMREHKIFMFTSDFKEGWGAVLNEAMASGCAVVASSAAGATPFLVKHNHNGLVYKYGNYKNAYKCVTELLQNTDKAEQLGNNAKMTIQNQYNGELAAERFVKAVEEFNKTGSITPCENDVMSQAHIIKNNWFKL